MPKIGVQMFMFKDVITEIGPYETLKKFHELGFSSVEVSKVPMTAENISELKKASEDFNIEISAMSAAVDPQFPGGESLSTDFDKIVADCKTLGCKFLRIGILPFTYLGSEEKSIKFAKECDKYAEMLDKHGIKLYYHNHHCEFIKYDGKYLLDLIKENTSKLGFEIDVFWVQRGGENPVKIIREYKGRVDLVHLKDYQIVEPDFGDIDITNTSEAFKAFNDTVRFAEVGDGSLDFTEIVKAAVDADVKYLFIEQDDTYGRDPFKCLEKSKEYLIKLGFGNML
ncbi:MAG: sugar phosphate isomerase [Epulopiscium sp. Nele67-Bin004]|nr:MAG: sugar phosphate isomerase [Epulopiscium sp. Nele67-Bin004]